MRVSKIGEATCSVARALGAIGDAWTLLILRELFLGQHRFEEFQAQTGMAPYLLSRRLAKLVSQGILSRLPYRQRPTRYEYRLTEKGLDLHAVVISLARWGDRWEAGKAGPPLTLIHKACGHETSPVLTCSACQMPVGPYDLRAKIGPAMLMERTANRDRFRAKTRRKADPNPPVSLPPGPTEPPQR
jgi:DNA-binding HxlR family transcriptional regulator